MVFGRPFVIKNKTSIECGIQSGLPARDTDLVMANLWTASYGHPRTPRSALTSESGWDYEMVCFPCVQKAKYGIYLFFNGNSFGETGFGVAALEA